MRPFRSRVLAAIVFAVLVLGMLGSVANAVQIPSRNSFPEDPWSATRNSFPEDPWFGRTNSFPEDPWPSAN